MSKIDECPESCPHCPPSRFYEDCPVMECIYYKDKETLGDEKYHRMVDERK